MRINGHEVVDRHNRPSVNQRVALRAFFMNDGVFQDPYAISGVTIFNIAADTSPSTLLGVPMTGLISSGVSSNVLMHFGNGNVNTTSTEYAETNYAATTASKGIYKLGTGQYVVVLDGTIDLSGTYNFWGAGGGTQIANTASAAANYLDVWTVKLVAASNYKSMIQDFTLHDDTFMILSEPLLLKSTSKLINKKIKLNSQIDLKISNEVTLENKGLDRSIINIFKDSAITGAALKIEKHNDEPGLPARVTVADFSDTAASVDITADNTLVYNWDTGDLATHSQTVAGNLGSLTGHYSVQAKFQLLNQIIYTDLFNLIVY